MASDPYEKYDTFWKRFGSSFIDGIVFFPLSLLINWIPATDAYSVAGLNLLSLVCVTLYYVIGHGKYGQTIGKRLMNIRVLDIDEKEVIGYKRAFVRECIWFFSSLGSIIYFIVIANRESELTPAEYVTSDPTLYISLGWLLLELLTMMFNKKRRAVHDFMAGSVVIDITAAQREKLFEKYQNIQTP